jgi:hypothetical protein
MRASKTITALAVLALALVACSPGEELAEQVLESEEGVGDVEIDAGSGEVRIEGEGEDGESFSIGGGEIPDGFPIDVPGGGEVQSVVEQGDEALVAVRWEDDFDSIASFYEDWVGSHGEVVNKTEVSEPQSVSWTVEDGNQAYAITVSDAGIFVQASLMATENN